MSDVIYNHTPDMGEISGFGGGYEAVCQQMLHQGVAWLVEHQNADIQVKEYANIYGVVDLVGEDTEKLEKAMSEGIEDYTGAMHHAVMSRLNYIAKNGWDKYCEEVRKYRKEKEA